MTNLKQSFLAAAKECSDTLLEAVVGQDDRESYSERTHKGPYPVESWASAAEKLNYEYDSGYGGADCHAVIVWGEKYVYFVHEYDGATHIAKMPRNPQPCEPYWADVDIGLY